ncbi:hypothetical protein ACFWY9_37860 [Amycolatopsis sp. NPDC059027]|uniref:hypothetical protein n=1 Tax=Amycolatopsis sp. NPDC059027 TaxID=3346709 RepID=UPI0036730C65
MSESIRDEIRKLLTGLTEGTIARDEAAQWARPWLAEEAGDVQDEAVWDTIDALSAADSATPDQGFLYGPEDFRAWLAEFDARVAGR